MCDSKCGICESESPEFLCLCEEVTVCRRCISQHIVKGSAFGHKTLTLDCKELIEAVHIQSPIEPTAGLFPDCPEPNIEKRKAVRRLVLSQISKIQDFKVAAEEQLNQIKSRWEEQLSHILSLAHEEMNSRVEETMKVLTQVLSDIQTNDSVLEEYWSEGRREEDDLIDLHSEVKNTNLFDILHPAMTFDFKFIKHREGIVLYKFFGGMKQVGVFEAKTESFTRMIPATRKFFHNSSSCQSASGLVYLTGGSLTGRSRNDAATFDPLTGEVKVLQAMQTARRSHASICVGATCFVFGGLLEEDRTSLCEKYSEEHEAWLSVKHMHERRAYHGCCLFQGIVYLSGGAANLSCEKFCPEDETFELLPLCEPGLEDNCSLAALNDSLIVFYGSYQGLVLRYYPENGTVKKLKDMCYGNSWSSCAPVVRNKCIYMLRSESLFKYNYETEESAYVLRMSKSGQRAPEL